MDDRDLQIVKTYGRGVGVFKKGNAFPKFETYREQIDGKYWFPTYTIANDTLHFPNTTSASSKPFATKTISSSGASTASPSATKLNNPNRIEPEARGRPAEETLVSDSWVLRKTPKLAGGTADVIDSAWLYT